MDQFPILVGAITGFTEAAKLAGLPTRYAPLFAIALGAA